MDKLASHGHDLSLCAMVNTRLCVFFFLRLLGDKRTAIASSHHCWRRHLHWRGVLKATPPRGQLAYSSMLATLGRDTSIHTLSHHTHGLPIPPSDSACPKNIAPHCYRLSHVVPFKFSSRSIGWQETPFWKNAKRVHILIRLFFQPFLCYTVELA